MTSSEIYLGLIARTSGFIPAVGVAPDSDRHNCKERNQRVTSSLTVANC